MYTATITSLDGQVQHETGEAKNALYDVYVWASVQGIAGHDVIESLCYKMGAECFILSNCHTGENVRLDIVCSDVI